MARRKRSRKKTKSKKQSNREVTIKAHTRSPRGPDRGKPRVVVKGYRRRKPRSRR